MTRLTRFTRRVFAAALSALTAMPPITHGILIATGSVLAVVSSTTYAEPPPWAPAHGWRRQHDPEYTGYTGKKWDRDYGVINGRCDRQAIGAAVGPTAGSVFASQAGQGTTAILIGAIIDVVIGSQAGRTPTPDAIDRACLAHALELSRDKQRVTWVNPDTGVGYLLSPTRGFQQHGRICRDFSLRMTVGQQQQSGLGTACQDGSGAWQIVKGDKRVSRR